MSSHSSARSSLEEPFWEERGCSALSKNNPVAGPKITKLLWSSAGLEAGPRQLLLAAPRVCCAAGAAGGGRGVPHFGLEENIGYRMARGDGDAQPGNGAGRAEFALGKVS